MKIHFTIFFALLFITLFGQISLTAKLAPTPGDSLYYAIDNTTTGITISAPGGNQNWDFSQLNSNVTRSEIYRHPSEGINSSYFSSAHVMLQQNIYEYYYRTFSNRIELLGSGLRTGDLFPGVSGVNVFRRPAVSQRYPQNYLDTLSYRDVNSVSFSSDILPDSLLNSLPIKPDSIRITYNTQFSKETDAWGTVKLPARSWNVLREKRHTVNRISVEGKVFTVWLDVTPLISQIIPGLFGTFESNSYAFVSDETKGLIALINVDSLNNVTNVQFKPDDKIVLKTSDDVSVQTIGVFPNPAGAELYFTLNNLPSGYYNVAIVEAQGRISSKQKMFIDEREISKLSIGDLQAGSYFLQISDKKNRKYNSVPFQKN
jgi:hypothetical protein